MVSNIRNTTSISPGPCPFAVQIDTEGFDATVIQGAMESIARGRIGLISFEYHEVGAWKEYKLKHVVEWLSGFNYVWYVP